MATARQRIAASAVAVVAVVVLGGAACGGKPPPPGTVSSWTDDVVRNISRGSDDLPRIFRAPPPSFVDPDAARLAEETKTVVVSAACEAATSLATNSSLPTSGDWAEWAAEYLHERLTGYPFDLEEFVEDKAEQLAATIELLQHNPQLALRYAQQCRLVGL